MIQAFIAIGGVAAVVALFQIVRLLGAILDEIRERWPKPGEDEDDDP